MITTGALVPADPQARADLAVRVFRSGRPGQVTRRDQPSPGGGRRASHGILRDHPRWSAFWDKRYGLWRVAEDDPDSDLYAESSQATTVIAYIQAHSRDW
jgi:hypothetical protein